MSEFPEKDLLVDSMLHVEVVKKALKERQRSILTTIVALAMLLPLLGGCAGLAVRVFTAFVGIE